MCAVVEADHRLNPGPGHAGDGGSLQYTSIGLTGCESQLLHRSKIVFICWAAVFTLLTGSIFKKKNLYTILWECSEFALPDFSL